MARLLRYSQAAGRPLPPPSWRRAGSSPRTQTRLGHASARTTLDVYGHLFPDEEDRTKAAIDEALAAPAA